MASCQRRHRGPTRFIAGILRLIIQCVYNSSVLKIVLLILVLLLLTIAITTINGPNVPFVLLSGFPVIVAPDDTYPSILGSDVSEKLSPELLHNVETRFKYHEIRNLKSPFKLLSVPQRRPNCLRMIQGSKDEIAYSLKYMENNKPSRASLSEYSAATSSCEEFVKSRGYILHSLPEERDFPIAYGIMMYRDTDQVEHLLRAIYRPHNFYCIHIDAKSKIELQNAMKQIAGCFSNVFLSSKQNAVTWSKFDSLEPWLYCMQDLWRYSWRYFINLTGQEFPLKTNLQIVKVLKALNGSNVVDTTTHPDYSKRWYENLPPPFNIKPFKGLVFMLASRGFVDYILHSQVAKIFLEWVRNTDFPDETFFSSLNHNPDLMVPGSYRGNPETNAEHKPFIARFVNWGVGWMDSKNRYPFSWPCGGKRVRRVCVFGVKDLQLLTDRKELFANKFMIDFQPFALDCIEEWHLNLTLVEYAGKLSIDITWYQSLNIVSNKVL